ncbi:hypothetical protein VKT23_008119 [Stygiomarasmius scandens]|uniref:FAD dependent oxidoreductase domain-containing protein n=1 Tax=Marasmiellus scandens TaxID=2682957 RepID=A0ABR1JKK5_9AGAR
MPASPSDRVLIIGAGCFGLSTAYHLLRKGYQNVTILDRSEVLPAPDAASNDINRLVRSSYADPFYAKFAKEAMHAWKDEKEWNRGIYTETGAIVINSSSDPCASPIYQNDLSVGCRLQPLSDSSSIREVFPSSLQPLLPDFQGRSGYLNLDTAVVNAGQATSLLLRKIVELGGNVIPGKSVRRLLRTASVSSTEEGSAETRTRGVECSDGTVYHADVVVVATGAWTASIFSEVDDVNLERMCLASGQCLVMMDLSDEEASLYRQVPVIMDLDHLWYYFPPNPNSNTVKLIIDYAGFTNTIPVLEQLSNVKSDAEPASLEHITPQGQRKEPLRKAVSTPRTIISNPENGLAVPKLVLNDVRNGLKRFFPNTLAKKDFSSTRMCWYTDSPDRNWNIGYHPNDDGLIFATSGSGHAYKFLPNIGTLVVQVLEGTLDPNLVKKFAIDREIGEERAVRRNGDLEELVTGELCEYEDLVYREVV